MQIFRSIMQILGHGMLTPDFFEISHVNPQPWYRKTLCAEENVIYVKNDNETTNQDVHRAPLVDQRPEHLAILVSKRPMM